MQKLIAILALAWVASPVLAQSPTDPGFEAPAQEYGRFAYRPSGSAWTFAGGAGLAANGSGFTASNPVAPQGSQVAFLQSNAAISQTITGWTAGTYLVTFQAAQRAGWPPEGSSQDLAISLDGKLVTSVTPAGSDWQTYYTASFTVAAGDHVLSIQGTNTTGDNTALVDSVSVVTPGPIVPQVATRAVVMTSGKMVGFTFTGLTSGQPVIPGQILVAPSLSVNGQTIGQLGTRWHTSYHPITQFATPGNYQIRPGDTVTVSAPVLWANTPLGAVQALNKLAAQNRAGKPMLATETFTRTLRIGVNNNQAPTSSSLGFFFPLKNWKYRVGWPPSNRGKLSAPPVTLPLDHHAMSNGIDNTKYPGMSGLWLLEWDASNPTAPVQFTIQTGTPAQCTVTERLDLARAPPDGVGMCRVFDVQPILGAASADFDVSLSYVDPAWSGTPAYENLWVVQPGDWDIVDGAVLLDRSDPWAISRIYQDRVGSGVGSMRWVDSTITGGNPQSAPYPELLPNASDENWGDLSFVHWTVGYSSVGPVDVAATPWVYSPFFRQSGQTFTATLSAPVTTAPKPGTDETWTFSDGDSAPLMAGLEITADAEVCRIISGSGTSWLVNRGSNGTTPATHQPGPVSVSGRRPIRDVLNADGGMARGLVTQFTTVTPHGRTTGNGISQDGVGWPLVTYTDGSVANLQGFGRQVYVTGPDKFFHAFGSNGAGGVPSQVYPLDPTRQIWDGRCGGGIPIEVAAIVTGRFPKADLHVNVPIDACDDMVWEIARRVLASFPRGRRVYVEYSNEPWNWAFSGFYYHSAIMGPLCVPGNPYQLAHYAYRASQVQAIFRSVFATAGRAGEIHGLINCQMGSGDSQVRPHLEFGQTIGKPFNAVAVAPYWSLEKTTYNQAVAAKLDDEQLIDVIGADLRLNPRQNNAGMASIKAALDAYNKRFAANCRLVGYEGGIEFADPWNEKRNHDLIYNPLWYHTELDWLAWCQNWGFDRIHIYNHAMWWNPAGWGGYHTPQQRHGRGDGLNGGANNMLWRRDVRGAGINQDVHVDAVRPQAWLDWLGTIP